MNSKVLGVYPDMVLGTPVIKTPISPTGLPNQGGITLWEFDNAVELAMFLGKHDDIFCFNHLELIRFTKRNLK